MVSEPNQNSNPNPNQDSIEQNAPDQLPSTSGVQQKVTQNPKRWSIIPGGSLGVQREKIYRGVIDLIIHDENVRTKDIRKWVEEMGFHSGRFVVTVTVTDSGVGTQYKAQLIFTHDEDAAKFYKQFKLDSPDAKMLNIYNSSEESEGLTSSSLSGASPSPISYVSEEIASSVTPSPDRYITKKQRKANSLFMQCLEKNTFKKKGNVIPQFSVIKTENGLHVTKAFLLYDTKCDDD